MVSISGSLPGFRNEPEGKVSGPAGPVCSIRLYGASTSRTFSPGTRRPDRTILRSVYLVVSFLEGNFVTPLVLGRRLTLNPVVIFVGLLFWFFLWGIPGALLAVPILAVFKIVCDHVDTLAPIGEFFGPASDASAFPPTRLSGRDGPAGRRRAVSPIEQTRRGGASSLPVRFSREWTSSDGRRIRTRCGELGAVLRSFKEGARSCCGRFSWCLPCCGCWASVSTSAVV
jgi:hypothetical protein